jgi:methyltransferase (TIGR00027 family)
MNTLIRPLLHISLVKQKLIKQYPVGMYEYVIARTKFIDNQFVRALEQGLEQILIFGAGFDTRGIRFGSRAENTRIFELDAPVTQSAKIERYHQKKIEIPKNLIYIPIDFDLESLSERLIQKGFEKGRSSLFILEGLTMYLQPASVDSTFKTIKEFSGPGSRIVFDHIYTSVIRRENLYEGEQEIYQKVAVSGECFNFGIEKGHADEFLNTYGFAVEKIMDADALDEMFFRDTQGKHVGHVNKTHCIVTATAK